MSRIYKVFLIILVSILAVNIALFAYTNNEKAANLYSTFIGLCLEGIVFVVLLNFLEKKISDKERANLLLAEKQRKVELKKILTEQYQIFFRYIDQMFQKEDLSNYSLSDKINFYKRQKDIIISGGATTLFDGMLEFKGNIFESLIPIAAMIGPNHLGAWERIITDLKGLKASFKNHVTGENDNLLEVLISFLSFIDYFEKLEIE